MRAVAALLVVWAHSIDTAELTGSKPVLAFGNLENFGAFGVDIFFVISGYIISASSEHRSWDQFAKARFFRVAPIFYLLSIPWIYRTVHVGVFDPRHLVPTFLFWPMIGGMFYEPYLTVGWTLSFEMLFYAVMAIAVLLGWLSAPLLTALIFLGLAALHLLLPAPILSFIGNGIILEFLFGILIWRFAPKVKSIAPFLLMFALLALSFQLVQGFGNLGDSLYTQDSTLSLKRAVLWGLPAAAIVLFAISIKDANPSLRSVRSVAFLGDASYSIYLSHLLALEGVTAIARLGILSSDSVVVLGFVASIIAGCISYELLERPITKLAKRIQG